MHEVFLLCQLWLGCISLNLGCNRAKKQELTGKLEAVCGGVSIFSYASSVRLHRPLVGKFLVAHHSEARGRFIK